MKREARESSGPAGVFTLPELSQSSHEQIIYLTAAAAAKAAATALLTNQVVRQVRVTLLDGRKASFKVDKCVLESGSAFCAVVGTRTATEGADNLPEVRVRVAWEEKVTDAPLPVDPEFTLPATPSELLWLQVDNPGKRTTEKLVEAVTTTEVTGPAQLRQIPLFLHFGPEGHAVYSLEQLPRELLVEAVREALVALPASRWKQGVRVYVSLAEEVGGLPKLPAKAVTNLVEVLPLEATRLGLALDQHSSEALPLLLEDQDELFIDLAAHELTLKEVFDQLGAINQLNTVTVGGNLATLVALASGDLGALEVTTADTEFLAAIAQRRDLDSYTVQSLRTCYSVSDLIHLLSRRRLGWLFDEVCRLACGEIRKQLTRQIRLETIVFGATGAVLGRALAEPAIFRL